MKKIISIPPTYLFICLILSVGFYWALPQFNLISYPYNLFGLLLMAFGFCLVLYAWFLFKRHNTPVTFNPVKYLVQESLYKYSRNPIYLGMTMFLIGLSFFTGNILSFISPFFFFLIVHFMFIPYEEQILEEIFGQAYLNYKKSTRRWI